MEPEELTPELAELDALLAERFAPVQAPPTLRAALLQRLPARVSPLPSLLDWLGWSAMLAAAALVLHVYLPPGLLQTIAHQLNRN